jgi:uncharacterized membrane protein
VYQLANLLKEKAIFSNFIIGMVLSLVGIFIAMFFGLYSFLSAFLLGGGRGEAAAAGFGLGIIIAIVVAYILGIVAANFYKESFYLLRDKIKQGLFGTGGLLLFIGQILIIVFGIGAIIILVGWLLITIAFFSLPDELEHELA